MEIGKRIAMLREKANFTQNRLAEWSGVSQSHLRRVELGQSDITVGHLQLICDVLHVSLSDFFAENDNADELSQAIGKLTEEQREKLLLFIKSL